MGSHRHEKVAKMGQQPGDISRRKKIAMMEGDTPVLVHPWQVITQKAAKGYKRDQVKRAKVKVKRRLDKEMQAALREG